MHISLLALGDQALAAFVYALLSANLIPMNPGNLAKQVAPLTGLTFPLT